MFLNKEDRTLFFKLWFMLIYSINGKHKIVPPFERPIYGDYVDREAIFTIRNALWENPSFIDEFLAGDGAMLSDEEKAILMSWRANFIKDKIIYDSFFIITGTLFDPGMERTFAEDYKRIKDESGIIVSM